MKELKEPTAPAPIPSTAGQYATVQDTQRALRDLHGRIVAMNQEPITSTATPEQQN